MDAVLSLPVLIGLIAVALAFDFLNGLHDAANSIATIVSTRVLRPQYAVAWAAFFNFIAFLFFGLHVRHQEFKDRRVGAALFDIEAERAGLEAHQSVAAVGDGQAERGFVEARGFRPVFGADDDIAGGMDGAGHGVLRRVGNGARSAV